MRRSEQMQFQLNDYQPGYRDLILVPGWILDDPRISAEQKVQMALECRQVKDPETGELISGGVPVPA